MKIAITGATGFVGRHLARSLSYQGHELVLIARGLDGRDRTVRRVHGAQFHAASVTDEEELVCVFEGCDAVAHFAGINREMGSRPTRRFILRARRRSSTRRGGRV